MRFVPAGGILPVAVLSYPRFIQYERMPIESCSIFGIRMRIHIDPNIQAPQPSTSDEIGTLGPLRVMADYWDLSIIGASDCEHMKQVAQSIM